MSKIEFCAPIPNNILTNGPIMVTSNDTAYTESWTLIRKNFFGVEMKFDSDTDVNIRVDLEQGNIAPTVQGSYSATMVTTVYNLVTITDEETHIIPVAPVVSVYARLKLVGLYTVLSSNSVTTVLSRAQWVEVEA